MWSFIKSQKLCYNLREGPFKIYRELSLPNTSQMLLTLEILLYGTIFLLKLNPAIQFSNLKPKLKNLGNVDCGCFFAGKLVLQ